MPPRLFLLLPIAVGLAACDAVPAENSTSGPVMGSASGGPATSDWTAADACALVDRGDLAEAVGVGVTGTRLIEPQAGGTESAAMSQCDYTLEGGQTVSLFTRLAPIAENSDASIGRARDGAALLDRAGVETVPGLGRAAFWLPTLRQLQMFAGDDRFVTVTMPIEGDADAARTQATAIARLAIGG